MIKSALDSALYFYHDDYFHELFSIFFLWLFGVPFVNYPHHAGFAYPGTARPGLVVAIHSTLSGGVLLV